MINDLLRNIIETEDIAAFINDIIVETKTEERHNKIVGEVLKRIVENNLFVKLEKYI